MTRKCNEHIREALDLANKLSLLSEEGEQDAEDNGCAVLYCIVRDCAYKIRAKAESEKESHRLSGKWI